MIFVAFVMNIDIDLAFDVHAMKALWIYRSPSCLVHPFIFENITLKCIFYSPAILGEIAQVPYFHVCYNVSVHFYGSPFEKNFNQMRKANNSISIIMHFIDFGRKLSTASSLVFFNVMFVKTNTAHKMQSVK